MPAKFAMAAAAISFAMAAGPAVAGPALYFLYDDVSFSASECTRRADRALVAAGLSAPGNTERVGKSNFLVGENTTVTSIIDCSTVDRVGRVTVMSAAANIDAARSITQRLLKAVKGE